jgi:HAD superfamily hydrolase (TIGR01509 family)
MDGLIFDTERLIRRAVQQASRSVGFEISDVFYNSMIGVPSPEFDSLIQTQFGPTLPFPDYLAAYRRERSRLLAQGVPLKPGAVEILNHLHQMQIPLGLATSSSRETTAHHLSHSGLAHFFDATVTRNDVDRGKPYPDLFLTAADRLGIGPDRCLVLEDSYNGIRAARAAGCLPIMVPDLLDATDEMKELCLTIASDLTEVRVLFGNTP